MISKQYSEVLNATHAQYPGWGRASRHVAPVVALMNTLHGKTILDFGAGKGAFKNACPSSFTVTNYDPGIAAYNTLPSGKFDAVVCTHVLEHVEPELLLETLNEIKARAIKLVYIEVPHGAANKKLCDGRDAHLIQQPGAWWMHTLAGVFADWTISYGTAQNPVNTVFVITK